MKWHATVRFMNYYKANIGYRLQLLPGLLAAFILIYLAWVFVLLTSGTLWLRWALGILIGAILLLGVLALRVWAQMRLLKKS
jgi:hypothetical protein